MGQDDHRWRVQHHIKVEKVDDGLPTGVVIFIVVCILLGLIFGN